MIINLLRTCRSLYSQISYMLFVLIFKLNYPVRIRLGFYLIYCQWLRRYYAERLEKGIWTYSLSIDILKVVTCNPIVFHIVWAFRTTSTYNRIKSYFSFIVIDNIVIDNSIFSRFSFISLYFRLTIMDSDCIKSFGISHIHLHI